MKHMQNENTVSEYDQQAESFLAKFGIKFRATLSDSKPAPWRDGKGREGHHYRITLSKGAQGHVVFDFWGSIADTESGKTELSAYDVLACISSDVNCPETFEDFCSEYGESADSIKALQTFRRASAFGKRLRAFFTPEEIEALSEIQ